MSLLSACSMRACASSAWMIRRLWAKSSAILLLLCLAYAATAQTRLILNSGNTITPLAGTGKDGSTIAGPATDADMGSSRGLLYDASGNLYVADSRNHIVTRISPSGALTIVAGTGREGFSGDGGPATSADLSRPSALALGNDGTLYIADAGNHRIRAVAASGIIRTFAGTGIPGDIGDGGPAASARLRTPYGLVFDGNGNLLVADSANHRIRHISANGIITAAAGTGQEGDSGDGGPALAATFRSPGAMLLLADGSILIADTEARRLRLLSPDGKVAAYTATAVRRPEGLATDAAGNLLIADAGLQQVLQATASGSTNLAGNGLQGTSVAGQADKTPLDSPSAATTDSNGGVAISDRRNHRIEHVSLPSLNFGSVPAGKASLAQTVTVQNGGNNTLRVVSITLPQGFEQAQGGTCAAVPLTLAPQQQCTLALLFHPQIQGTSSGIGKVALDVGPASMLLLTGIGSAGTDLAASTTVLTSTGTISYSGEPIQLKATVTGSLLAAPTGNITFLDGDATLTTIPLTSGAATISTAALSPGQHTLRAAYDGDAMYAASTSATISQTVVAAPDFSLTASATSYSGKAAGTVSIPLTLLPIHGTLNHTVTLSVSGLPTGATGVFVPAAVTLAGTPVIVSLAITLPSALASHSDLPTGVLAAVLLLPAVAFRRKYSAVSLLILTTATLSMSGCGGGFRTTTSGGTDPATYHYNPTITASTTGVLGDTLTHSIPVELVITQ